MNNIYGLKKLSNNLEKSIDYNYLTITHMMRTKSITFPNQTLIMNLDSKLKIKVPPNVLNRKL
jgi:hypothetical protein